MVAAKKGHEATVKPLVDNGAEPEEVDAVGKLA